MAKAKLVVGAKVQVYRYTKGAISACLPDSILNCSGTITRGIESSKYFGVTLFIDDHEWYIPPSCLKRVD